MLYPLEGAIPGRLPRHHQWHQLRALRVRANRYQELHHRWLPVDITDPTYGAAEEGQIGTGTTPEYNAAAGYNLATGLGTIDRLEFSS